MTVEPLLIATRSSGKLRELRALFGSAGIPVVDLIEAGLEASTEEDDLENADTFEENALAKARYFARRGGRAVVADDSGLEVEALGRQPGVRSKRWSGRADLSGVALDDANNAHLLRALCGVTDRRARYVCVAAYVDRTEELTARGTSSGIILERPCGQGGFGYDPYFLSDELGRTFAEASVAEKERVSHRGRAFRALIAALSSRR
ncbi:MAG TPA: non-canonical purine NTP pyrophosphatase [Gemmatimonadaceae bacterium]|nr:non-canonical purine NTP pyrophosphatase [Gemmatimonadaceae bacterium]